MRSAQGAPRLILASEFWHGATGRALAQGFRNLGWEVEEVDIREHFLQPTTTPLRIASRLLQSLATSSYNLAVLKTASRVRATAFLAVKGNYIRRETIKSLRNCGIVTAVYFPDFHFGHRGVDIAVYDDCDFFFATKSFQMPFIQERFPQTRARFVHHGYSSLVHLPLVASVPESDMVHDVIYVGNPSPHKLRWLTAIAKRLPEVSLAVFGNQWRRAAAGTALATRVFDHPVTGDFYARSAQHSRINLAVHHGPLEPGGWEDLVSTRTFEIPACKGFMLHIDNPEVRELFDVDREIDVFATEDELVDKIRFYLARPERRAEMVESAYIRCVPAYSYEARAAVMAAEIEAVRETRHLG